MSTNVYDKYRRIIDKVDKNTTIEEWYLKSCILDNSLKSSDIQHFLASLEQIKHDKETKESIIIPILSNHIFKGIFKKQSGNSSFYNSFTLKQYQNDGVKMIKEYKYDSNNCKDQKLEIIELTRIYNIIDEIIDGFKTLETGNPNEAAYKSISQKLNAINDKVDNIIEIFANEHNHGISLSLDKHLNIEIYLKKDSMVIRFRLKNSVTTIGYINDPFLINTYAKLMHIHDTLSKIVYNLNEIN